MPHWRAYIRKKIIDRPDLGEGVREGGDFVRVVDLEAEGSPVAEINRQLEPDEEIDQIVTLTVDEPDLHYGTRGDVLSG